jgi:hypothetical protein
LISRRPFFGHVFPNCGIGSSTDGSVVL